MQHCSSEDDDRAGSHVAADRSGCAVLCCAVTMVTTILTTKGTAQCCTVRCTVLYCAVLHCAVLALCSTAHHTTTQHSKSQCSSSHVRPDYVMSRKRYNLAAIHDGIRVFLPHFCPWGKSGAKKREYRGDLVRNMTHIAVLHSTALHCAVAGRTTAGLAVTSTLTRACAVQCSAALHCK